MTWEQVANHAIDVVFILGIAFIIEHGIVFIVGFIAGYTKGQKPPWG
jgi:hypothetical protein